MYLKEMQTCIENRRWLPFTYIKEETNSNTFLRVSSIEIKEGLPSLVFYSNFPTDALQTQTRPHNLRQLVNAWVVCVQASDVFRSESPSVWLSPVCKYACKLTSNGAHPPHPLVHTHSLINIASLFCVISLPRERPVSTGCTALLDQ